MAQIASKVGVCVTTLKRVILKHKLPQRKRRYAKRETAIDDTKIVQFKAAWDKLDSTVKGTIAENHVKNRLSELGFDVWEPFCQNHKTDLFILEGRDIRKVQVKSATYDRKTKAFRANVTRRRRQGKKSGYELEDVDFFIVYCGGLDTLEFYVAPANLVIGRTDMKLYPHRSKGAFAGGPEWETFRNAFNLLGKLQ